jgi:O-antigen/teichoic acid export membrane protein
VANVTAEQALTPSASHEEARGRADLPSLARGGGLNLFAAIVGAIINLGLTVIVARGFGQADAGAFFSVTSLFLILEASAKLGADTGMLFFLPRYRALERDVDVPTVLRAALPPVLIGGGIMALGVLIAAPWLSDVLANKSAHNFTNLLRLLAVFLPLAAAYDVAMAATRGFSTMTPTALVEKIGRPLAQPLLALLVLVAAPGAVWLTFSWALPYAPAALATWILLRRMLHRNRQRAVGQHPRALRDVRRDFWGYTRTRSVASVCQVALQRADIVIVAALRSPKEAAVYAAASRFLVVGQLGQQAIQQAVQPKLSELLARTEHTAADLVYKTSNAWLMMISWPLYLLFATFSTFLLSVLGHGYSHGKAPHVVLILSLSMLVATGCGPVDMVLLMSGRSSWSLANMSGALAIDVGLDLILVPKMGITGAAIGWAVALIVSNVVPLFQVKHHMGLDPLGRTVFRVALLSVGCFGVTAVTVRLILGGGAVGALTAGALGILLYAVGLYLSRRTLELHILSAMLRRRRPAPPIPESAPTVTEV